MNDLWGVSVVDTGLDSRAITFENPTGERGAGGRAAGGRKGAPSRRLRAGERMVLADLEGPGVVRHIWMTFPPAPPESDREATGCDTPARSKVAPAAIEIGELDGTL